MEKHIWICIEKAENNYGAFAPEVPGCVSTGATVEETKANMAEALTFHLESMLEDGDALDSITGNFPLAEAADSKRDQDYWVLVQVDVATPTEQVGV